MKKMIKRITAIAMVAVMMFAMNATVFAASTGDKINTNITLYKTGTSNTSMGNGAFANGGYIRYNYDDNGNVVSTFVYITSTTVKYMSIFSGYITDMKLNGQELTPDNESKPTVFTGTIDGKIEFGKVYVATVNISVSGFMNKDTNGDLVFSAK